MVPLHAVVHDRDDNARVARAELPSLVAVDVGTRLDLRIDRLVAGVDVVPLFAQVGIVEPDGRTGLRRSAGFGQRDDPAFVHVHQLLVEFHLAHFGDPGHVEGRLVEIGGGVELHNVPAVQAGGARALLVPFVYREQTL